MTESDALMTIGDFARDAGLKPKALRLYDDLGLLRPAEVDPHSGYRRCAPGHRHRPRPSIEERGTHHDHSHPHAPR